MEIKKTWKDKHNTLLKNKNDIIKLYKDYVPVKLIAREYGVSEPYIYKVLEQWGVGKRSGIKHLLGKMILEG